jgi:hypothetical protein
MLVVILSFTGLACDKNVYEAGGKPFHQSDGTVSARPLQLDARS